MGEKENQIQRHFPKELILGDLTILKGSLVLETHLRELVLYLTKSYKTIKKNLKRRQM